MEFSAGRPLDIENVSIWCQNAYFNKWRCLCCQYDWRNERKILFGVQLEVPSSYTIAWRINGSLMQRVLAKGVTCSSIYSTCCWGAGFGPTSQRPNSEFASWGRFSKDIQVRVFHAGYYLNFSFKKCVCFIGHSTQQQYRINQMYTLM